MIATCNFQLKCTESSTADKREYVSFSIEADQ